MDDGAGFGLAWGDDGMAVIGSMVHEADQPQVEAAFFHTAFTVAVKAMFFEHGSDIVFVGDGFRTPGVQSRGRNESHDRSHPAHVIIL